MSSIYLGSPLALQSFLEKRFYERAEELKGKGKHFVPMDRERSSFEIKGK
jgi:hypothetical protein